MFIVYFINLGELMLSNINFLSTLPVICVIHINTHFFNIFFFYIKSIWLMFNVYSEYAVQSFPIPN